MRSPPIIVDLSWLQKPSYTQDIDKYEKCITCSNKLLNIAMRNPVFGTKCIIDTKNKPKNDIFHEISKMSEIQPILNNEGNNRLLKHIYDKMCDPKQKNDRNFFILYCKTCDKILTSSYKITDKWCGIPYNSVKRQK